MCIRDRIVLFKPASKKFRKLRCDIYYNQTPAGWELDQPFGEEAHFDNRGNQANRRTYTGYLYDGGIREALKATSYEKWTRAFEQMAACLLYTSCPSVNESLDADASSTSALAFELFSISSGEALLAVEVSSDTSVFVSSVDSVSAAGLFALSLIHIYFTVPLLIAIPPKK